MTLRTIPRNSITLAREDCAEVIDFDVIFDAISGKKRLHLIGLHII